MSSHWCHECKSWKPSERDERSEYACLTCGWGIQCDVCGDRYSDDHNCEEG